MYGLFSGREVRRSNHWQPFLPTRLTPDWSAFFSRHLATIQPQGIETPVSSEERRRSNEEAPDRFLDLVQRLRVLAVH